MIHLICAMLNVVVWAEVDDDDDGGDDDYYYHHFLLLLLLRVEEATQW